jgi:hypothetical protein
MHVIPVLGRLTQEDNYFEDRPAYTVRSCLKKKKKRFFPHSKLKTRERIMINGILFFSFWYRDAKHMLYQGATSPAPVISS